MMNIKRKIFKPQLKTRTHMLIYQYFTNLHYMGRIHTADTVDDQINYLSMFKHVITLLFLTINTYRDGAGGSFKVGQDSSRPSS